MVAFMGAKVPKVEVQRRLKVGLMEQILTSCVNCKLGVWPQLL